jgi:hypothetical protein
VIEQTGSTYQSSKHSSILAIAEAKVGKTCFEVASCLGLFPGQKEGGVVTKPEHLHVLTFDANAAGGIKPFLMKTLNAPQEALNYRILNMQDSMRKVSQGDSDYDMKFYNEVQEAISKVADKIRPGEVHALVVSSLTGMAAGIERSLVGPPTGKGYSDQSKWNALAHQLAELQNYMQSLDAHIIWEAHLDKAPNSGQGGTGAKESIRVTGKSGRNWGYNVEQVFRVRRHFGQKCAGTQCDKVELDTRPSFDFIAGGRGTTENLNPTEGDLTSVLRRLGYNTGHWGGAKPEKKVLKTATARSIG